MAASFPPPAAPVLFPNPLTTGIAPLPAIDRRRGQQKSVLVAVDCNAFTNNEAAIVDGFGDSQHFEVARGKIAKQVEVVHLTIDSKEGVFGIVGGSGRSDDHPGCVEALSPRDASRAGRSAESSQVSDGVA